MLTVSHVTKRYGRTVANSDINLTIADGEICILLGPNGAGKSTLIKNITGFHKYDGDITVDGHVNKTIEAKRLMGYVPEIPSLYPTLTVEEHMEFIARVYRLTDYKEYKEELLERFELSDKRDKFGDELSKGMQQKLSVCCGLLPRPRMVLFDEPMIGLDPHAIKEMKKLFGELRAAGCALLVSTHMIDSIEELWDTTYIMKDGRIEAVVHRSDVEGGGKSLEDIFFEITEGVGAKDASNEENSINTEGGADS
ncbi:MAG: ABC transporter ATP-binding protein [Clostridiales bacterium]|nr:ABC transporter ATP-binding protein [Clostridiales bacterium]